METAMSIVDAKRSAGYSNLGEVNQATVDTFLAAIPASATVAELTKARDRMVSMIARGEKARGTNLPTMAATADAITAIIATR